MATFNSNVVSGAVADAEVYINGARDMAGIGKVTLPKISLKKISTSQFGQTAEIELGLIGHYEKMDFKMSMENINGSMGNVKIGETITVDTYFVAQNLDRSTQEVILDGLRASVRGQVLMFDAGDVKPGEKTEVNIEMSVFAYKLMQNDDIIFNVDALNTGSENKGDNRDFINQLLARI